MDQIIQTLLSFDGIGVIPWFATLVLILWVVYKMADCILVVASTLFRPAIFLGRILMLSLAIGGCRFKVIAYTVLSLLAGKKSIPTRPPTGGVVKL